MISVETWTGTDYADDLALPANTSAQAESLQHSQGQAAGGMNLDVNANKTEFTSFNEKVPTSL